MIRKRLGAGGEAWPLVVGFGFLVVYARALAFRFTEGDDAASIAFHALGRRSEVQPPYSIYHAGADLLLSVLPTSEPVLRTTAIGLGAVAAMVVFWQVLALVFSWVAASGGSAGGEEGERFRRARPLLAFFLLLAMPELFFLGLVYTPTVIGFALVLFAHRILRVAWRRSGGSGIAMAALAGLLFGMGGACRFDLVLYGGIIVLDLLLLDPDCLGGAFFKIRSEDRSRSDQRLPMARKVMVLAAFSAVAIVSWCLFLVLAGYRIEDLASVFGLARSVAVNNGSVFRYAIRFAASSQTLYPPVLLLLGVWGLTRLEGGQRWFVMVNGVGLLFAIFVLRWSVPKLHLIFLPGVLLPVCLGWLSLWGPAWGKPLTSENSGKRRFLRRTALSALLALPWLVGVHVAFPDTSWGRGYVLRWTDQSQTRASGLSLWSSGTAIPTPEGPRPLWGFLGTLLGGDQRRMTIDRDDGRRAAIAVSLDQELPIVILQGAPGLVQAELARRGLGTNDSPGDGAGRLEGPRRFGPATNAAGCAPCDTVSVFKLRGPVSSWIRSSSELASAIERFGTSRIVVVGYPGNLRDVRAFWPTAMELLGPESAILDLAVGRRSSAPPLSSTP